MKKLFCLVLSGIAILPAKLSVAQTSDNRLALHISENFHDFNISILNKKFSSFDSSLSHTFRVGIQYYINRHWTFVTAINNGFYMNQLQEGKLVRKSFATGIDADIQYKFNNGNRISEKSLIGPFVSFGYDLSYKSGNKSAGLNPVSVYNSYGLGANLRFSPSTSIVIQSSVYQHLGGDFETHINHRVAYVYTFGVNVTKPGTHDEEVPKPLKNDRDKDGVTDEDDVCPDFPGLEEYAGCPSNILENAGRKAAMDSLIKKVATIKGTLDSLKEEVKVVKSILEKPVDIPEKPQKPVESETKSDEKKNSQPPIVEEQKKEIIPIEVKPDKPNQDAPAYYVIVISTMQFKLANQTADKLDRDYPKVAILPQSNGYYRVGIFASYSKPEALKVLKDVKAHGMTNAWLSLE